ncbi:MAG TPA: hypothetical protein VD770_02360, partial [Coxiellaceae bacterium]|nr:hypothetical protein [Coxiellaceae bacterium]
MSLLNELKALFDTEDVREIVETIYNEIPYPIVTNTQALITHLANLSEQTKRKEFIAKLSQILEFVSEKNKPSLLKELISQSSQIDDYHNIIFSKARRDELRPTEVEPVLMAMVNFFKETPEKFYFLYQYLLTISSPSIENFIKHFSMLITAYPVLKGVGFITYIPPAIESRASCPHPPPITYLAIPSFEKKLKTLNSFLLQTAINDTPELAQEEAQKNAEENLRAVTITLLCRLAAPLCRAENYKILYLNPTLIESSFQLFRKY